MRPKDAASDSSDTDSLDLDVYDSEECLAGSAGASRVDCPHLYEHHLRTVCAFAVKCQHEAMPVCVLHSPTKSAGLWLPYVAINQCYKRDKVAALMTEYFLKQVK